MSLRRDYDKDFIYFFWEPFPKKVGKPAAEREWLKLNLTDDEKQEMRQHIELRVKWDKKWLPNEKGNTFIPDPERFLKHRRFEDEYERVKHHHAAPVYQKPELPIWQERGFASQEAYRAHCDAKAREALERLREVIH